MSNNMARILQSATNCNGEVSLKSVGTTHLQSDNYCKLSIHVGQDITVSDPATWDKLLLMRPSHQNETASRNFYRIYLFLCLQSVVSAVRCDE